MFDWLVALLADCPIFPALGKKPQCYVIVQLAAFLIKYGVMAPMPSRFLLT